KIEIDSSNRCPVGTKKAFSEVKKLVGLGNAIKTKVGRYSLGMRQRLGIAQALLHDPSVLILDEPTNGLDPAGIREIRKYIRRLADEENVAVIISSHLLSEIELMCDRIGVIKNGELIGIQSVHEQQAEEAPVSEVRLEVDPAEQAIQVLKVHHGIEAAEDRGFITVSAKKSLMPSIVTSLVSGDVLVYRVEVSSASLEDKFFDLIGENVIG